MIELKEYRIGNWVNHQFYIKVDWVDTTKPPPENKFEVRANQITEAAFISATHNDKGEPILWDCEPIPITPEILEKCGFVNKHGIFWQLQMGESYVKGTQVFSYSFMSERLQYSICHGGENEEYVYLENVELGGFPKLLHQLQNLIFALSGTELDIKL